MMNASWKKFKISELCELKYGKALKNSIRKPGKVPVYGSNGIVGYHNEALTQRETIIIGRKGSVGAIHYSDSLCWPIDTTYYLDYDESLLNLKWFEFILNKLRLQKLNKSAAVPGLNRNDVYRIKILLPPLKDQIRIATLLSRVEAIIAKRKVNISLLDELLRSTFLEMFGAENPDYEIWEKITLADLAASKKGSMRTGPFGSDLLHSEFTKSGDVRVLGIDNVVKNRFDWGEERYITLEKFEKLKRYQVFPGDVLISIMGTTGRSAVVPDSIPLCLNTKHLAAITLDKSKANPIFVSYSIHSSPQVLRQIQLRNRGAIMRGLNLTIIKKLKLKHPPLPLQNQFSKVVERVESIKARYESNLAELEELYNALSQRAFRGELDLDNIEAALDHHAPQSVEPQTEEPQIEEGKQEFSADDLFRLLQEDAFVQPFSFDILMTELAKTSLQEEPDYETVKEMVFDMLKQEPPVLSQSFHGLNEQKLKAVMLDVSTGIRDKQ